MKINKRALLQGVVAGLPMMFLFLLLFAFAVSMAKTMLSTEGSNKEVLSNLIMLMSNKIMVWGTAIMVGVGWGGTVYQETIRNQKMRQKMLQQVRNLVDDLEKESEAQ